METGWAILLTLIAYKLALLGIGVWAQRRTRSEDDFFLAGRGLGALTAGLSYAASASSAWVLLGFSGFVYAQGLSALWILPGIWTGYGVVWLGLGPRLQRETAEKGHVTLTDFLVTDLDPSTGRRAAALAALLIAVGFTLYVAPQLQGAADGFSTQLGMNATLAILLSAGIVLIYSWLGGFWAASVTDALQGVVMAVIALGLPVVAIAAAGGPGSLLSTLQNEAPAAFLDWTGGRPGLIFLGFVLGLSGVGLAYLGQPQLLTRLMAVRSDRARRQGFALAFGWAILVFSGMAVLGLAGRAVMPGLANGETLLYALAADLLPAALAGIVLAAVLSAVMSTVDSLLIAAASAVAHDLGITARRPRRALLLSRLVMAGVCAAAAAVALLAPATIFGRVLLVWSALGAAFGPVVIARVLNWRPAGWAVIAAIASGFGLAVLFNSVVLTDTPGAVAERLLPWLPPLLLLWLGRRPLTAPHGKPL